MLTTSKGQAHCVQPEVVVKYSMITMSKKVSKKIYYFLVLTLWFGDK